MSWATIAKAALVFSFWLIKFLTKRKLISEGEAKQIAKQNEESNEKLKAALDAITSVDRTDDGVLNDKNNRD